MEKSKRYVLVPEERLQHFAEDHLSDLDKQLHAILIQKGLSDDEKSTLYLQVLQKFVKFPVPAMQPETPVEKESPPEKENPPELSVKEETTNETPFNIEKDVMRSVPIQNRNLAHDLLQFLREHRDSVSWTPQKHLVINGQAIPRTNIVELINFVLRKKKKGPRAHALFINVLKQLNVPANVIVNPYLITEKKKKPVLYAKMYRWKAYSK